MIKYFSHLLLLLSVVLVTASGLHAQTKVAYVDASKILKRLPESVDATNRLDQLTSTWNRESDEIQAELSRKQSELDRRKLIMTDAERNAAEVDVQNLRKKLDDFRQSKYGANGDLFTQEAALMKPAYDKLMKAIDETAHDGGYDYVFDRSSKDLTMLFSNSKYDLTLLVAKKLGIETDIIAQPLINNSPGQRPLGMPNNGPGQTPSNPSSPGAFPNANTNPALTPNPFPNPNGQTVQPNGQVPPNQPIPGKNGNAPSH